MSDRPARFPLALAGLALLSAVAVLWISVTAFPHHSANHDEGVYLQQAELLLEGQLWLRTDHSDAFRPWFFVQDGPRLYPKYSPVPAAVFAAGMALGNARLALAGTAAALVALTGLVTAEAFDRRTGLLAAGLYAASPLFLVDAAVFLPYAQTAAFTLLFALGYLRAWRRDSARWAAVAGAAIGLAFFARPYTAVLFAAPFIVHAAWATVASRTDRPTLWAVGRRIGPIAALGAGFVGVTLGYNRVVTGSALLFPYRAFAPLDGLGFGLRRIAGYERVYTPWLAVRANARVLVAFATRWTAVPPLGTMAAAVGLVAFLAGLRDRRLCPSPPDLSATGARALLAGLVPSVVLGNVAFWGNLNLLADLSDPTDGLIALLGPFYHFDLLLPTSAFGAAGTVFLVDRGHALVASRASRPGARVAVLAALALSLPVVGAVGAGAVAAPLDRSAPYTERYERAYEPFEDRSLGNALVFVPTPYGDWLNHPFQSLRNDPGFDGAVVYALDRSAGGDFAIIDAFGNRTPYRYTYRGEWTPAADEGATARLRRLEVRRGAGHRIDTRLGWIAGAETVTVRLAGPNGTVHYGVATPPGETLELTWTVEPGEVRLDPAGLRQFSDARAVTFDRSADVALEVTFLQPGGSTVTYRQLLSVSASGGRVRLVWPPETRVCRLVPACGREGTYVPGAGDYVGGVAVNTTVATANRE